MFDPEALRSLLDDETATLDHAMALVSSIEVNAPDPAETAAKFDLLASDVSLSSPDELFTYLYGTLGFTGDENNYYSPDNSLVHRVLHRRKGIPLSLAVLATEVGRRHGISVQPVGMPGHVLISETDSGSEGRWFDPFGGGHVLDLNACRSLFARFAPGSTFSDEFLQPMTTLAVVTRTLANLFNAYARLGDLGQLIKVAQLQEVASPGPETQEVLVRLLEMAGRYEEAADQIEKRSKLSSGKASPDNTSANDISANERAEDQTAVNEGATSDVANKLRQLRAHRN